MDIDELFGRIEECNNITDGVDYLQDAIKFEESLIIDRKLNQNNVFIFR
jgi:hypothetical protein